MFTEEEKALLDTLYRDWVVDSAIDSTVDNTVDNDVPAITGGSNPSQYRKAMDLPVTGHRAVFVEVDLETADISDAFGFDGNEKDIFKAMTRTKPSNDQGYDLDKIVFYALRNRYNKGAVSHAEFWAQCVACGLADEI